MTRLLVSGIGRDDDVSRRVILATRLVRRASTDGGATR
jgi:hypothetical protein